MSPAKEAPKPQRTVSGWSVQLRFGKGRRKRFAMPRLSQDPTQDELKANARAATLGELADLLADITRLDASALLEFAAGRESDRDFNGAVRAAKDAAKNPEALPAPQKRWTFKDVAEAWLSGEIHRKYPFTLKPKSADSIAQSRGIFRVLYPVLGDKPVDEITREDVMAAKSAIPEGIGQASFARYARHIRIVMGLAVAPLELIDQSPVPPKFVPGYGPKRALGFLYPDEDAQLMSAPDDLVPFNYRFYYGLLARTGLRPTEGRRLTFGNFDLRRGILGIDKTKTKTPRAFVVSADVIAVVLSERERRSATEDDLLFHEVEKKDLATTFREHLTLAGIDRRALHQRTAERRPLRVHDLRGSFVTIALANGCNEDWVMQRTGHTTSAMLAKYRRQVDYARDAELEWWQPLDKCLSGQAAPPEGVARGVARRVKIQVEIPGLASPRWTWSVAPEAIPEPKTAGSAPAPAAEKPRESQGWHAPHQGVAREPAEQQRAMSAPADTQNDPVATALAEVEVLLAKAIDRATEAGEWATVRILAAELEARRKSREAQRTAGVTSLESVRARKNGDKP